MHLMHNTLKYSNTIHDQDSRRFTVSSRSKMYRSTYILQHVESCLAKRLNEQWVMSQCRIH